MSASGRRAWALLRTAGAMERPRTRGCCEANAPGPSPLACVSTRALRGEPMVSLRSAGGARRDHLDHNPLSPR